MSDYESVVQGLRRDINCLGDADRNTRRRALDRLGKALVSGRDPCAPAVAVQVLVSDLLKPLLRVLEDPVEKCRELALTLLADITALMRDAEENLVLILPYLSPVLVARLATVKVTEPSEELRLALLQYMTTVADLAQGAIAQFVDDFASIIQRTASDQFHDVKKETAALATLLCKHAPDRVAPHAPQLVKALVPNLGHQHSRVRVATLGAIGPLVLHGASTIIDDLLQHLKAVSNDRSGTVRERLAETLGMWILEHSDRYSYEGKLLPLVIQGVSDEIPAVQERSLGILERLGAQYEADHEEDIKDQLDFHVDKHAQVKLPAPFTARPPLGIRLVARHRLSQMMPGILADLEDWTAATRVRAARLLEHVLVYVEEFVTQHLEKLLPVVFRVWRDEDPAVTAKVADCLLLIGQYVPPGTLLPLLLPYVRGASALTATQRLSSLGVLSALLPGMAVHEGSSEHLGAVVAALVDPDFLQTEDSALRRELLSTVRVLIETAQDGCAPFSESVFTILLRLLSVYGDKALVKDAGAVLELLAEQLGLGSVQALYQQHFPPILQALLRGFREWNKFSPEYHVFHALLTGGGPVLEQHIGELVPVFVECSHPDKDAELRLAMLGLLEDLVAGGAGAVFAPHAVPLLRDIILPNAAWKVGRVSATVRLASMGCLGALLRGNVVDQATLGSALEALLPAVYTCLDDDLLEIRSVTTKTAQALTDSAAKLLDDDQRRQYYQELLKRLDDSNDAIRLGVCPALCGLLEAVPNEFFESPHVPHIAKIMLVHLDDTNGDIQDAALSVLKVVARRAPAVAIEETNAVKSKHRSPQYCAAVLEAAGAH